MAQPAKALPAWKRLGLKLKNADQYGEAVPQVNGNNDSNFAAKYDGGRRGGGKDVYSASGPSENGKPSGLGKRKHQDASAEDDSQTIKKSRTSADHEIPSGSTGTTFTASTKEENGPSESAPTAPDAGDKPKPKGGDPNYRQKKTKKPKYENWKQKKAAPVVQEAVEPEPKPQHKQLVQSIENHALPSVSTPQPSKKILRNASLEISPSRSDRRKSVAFTPDTKTADGTSAHNLFKQWAADQKAAQGDFTPAEVAQFVPPPKVHPANGVPAPQSLAKQEDQPAKEAKKSKKKQKANPSEEETESTPAQAQPTPTAAAAKPAKGKKKDPSVYLSYLSQYHNDPANWKFNKAKQNDVMDNALNVFRIPQEHEEALIVYVKGLKGAAVIERMKEKCDTTLKTLDAEEKTSQKSTSADAAAQQKAKEDALQERLTKEKKRRQTDADIEALAEAPDSEEFIRGLKRRRAEALRSALSIATPIAPLPPKPAPVVHASRVVFQDNAPAPPTVPAKRKRKSRTEVSSDESSSSSSDDSSSDDSSSDDSSSEDSDDDDDSSDSDSDSDSDVSNDSSPSSKAGDGDSSASDSSSNSEGESSGSDGDTEESDDSGDESE